MGSCSVSCIKFTLLLFNVFFIVGGLFAIFKGVQLGKSEASSGSPFSYSFNANHSIGNIGELNVIPSIFSTTVIVIGSIVIVVTVFGCCAAITKTPWMLTVYAVLVFLFALAVIFVAVTSGVAFDFPKQNDRSMKESLKKVLNDAYVADYSNASIKLTNFPGWDRVQTDFHCCGVDAPNDYTRAMVPSSCCAPGSATCAKKDAYQIGCYSLLQNFALETVLIFAYVAAAVGVCHIIISALAFWLASAIKNNVANGAHPYQEAPPLATNM